MGAFGLPAKSASFPKATHRCHSVRDSQDPASFFQDVLVASEKIAMLVALAAFLSASLPMKPIRVIRLSYIRFSLFCPLVSGTGKRVGAVREQSRSFAVAGRRKGPEAVPRRTDRTRERNRTDHHSASRRRRRNAA